MSRAQVPRAQARVALMGMQRIETLRERGCMHIVAITIVVLESCMRDVGLEVDCGIISSLVDHEHCFSQSELT